MNIALCIFFWVKNTSDSISVTTCEISYPCLIHSACDTHCTTASGCTTKGKDKCDTACVEGYGLEKTGYTCVGEYVYVTIFLINVVSQNRLILMCNNSASYTFL